VSGWRHSRIRYSNPGSSTIGIGSGEAGATAPTTIFASAGMNGDVAGTGAVMISTGSVLKIRNTLLAVVALSVATTLLAGCKDLGSDTPSSGGGTGSSTNQSVTGNQPVTQHQPATKPAKPAKPHGTLGQENALGAAQDYLDFQAFSRAGLIDQLSSRYGDASSKADATWAVNHLDVNWNEQAVKAAKDYLSMQHFSRAGLIEQLSSRYGDQFTRAQAIYGVNHVGL
jgi:hypothetical protein